MPLRLILVRHAKSSWDDPLIGDHDRPLNKRGRKSAQALGKWLAANDYIPTEVVSSTARRTLETWAGIAPSLPDGILVRRDPSLYHATSDMMLACLRNCAGSSVLMLAHNPGIADFAHRLVTKSPNHTRFLDYPTGATLVASFPIDDWKQLSLHSGESLNFVVPRELIEAEAPSPTD